MGSAGVILNHPTHRETMWKRGTFFIFLFSAILAALADDDIKENERSGKVLPIFQVVRFPNDVCTGTTRNGTCFTAEECSSKSGTNEGSCASGFGVCCVISLACGGSTSNNNSYIVQASTTTAPATPCTYSVCPCSSDICRIRYDFTTHTLASQHEGTVAAAGVVGTNSGIGDCEQDQFGISSPGAWGSPIICGTNTGQHMIIDSDGSNCQTVNFHIGAATTTTRSWDIYVTQYTCGQEDEAGPPGCLQYYTGTSGTIKNFGFPTSITAATGATTTTTHLSNQLYSMCIRRASGMCYICYIPFNSGVTTGTFGLGLAATDAMNDSEQGSFCLNDYITIPDGTTSTVAAATTPVIPAAIAGSARFCGRQLNSISGEMTASLSVCSRVYPFRINFRSDSTELCGAVGEHMCEFEGLAGNGPGGILGFALNYAQSSC